MGVAIRAFRAPLLTAALAAALAVASAHAERQTVHRVLFIGNSLTAANDLPEIVRSLAQSVGHRLDYRMVAFPDHSLEDQWNRPEARRALAEGQWTTVVLQQGPSALPESQRLLREYTRRFDEIIQRIGARTALYMVWPSNARRGDFPGVSASYKAAARDVGGLLFPAGDAWLAAWQRDRALPLYASDGFHPSAAGSYLAALVITQRLTGRSPIGLPAQVTSARLSLSIPADQARVLQEAAAEVTSSIVGVAASRSFGRRWMHGASHKVVELDCVIAGGRRCGMCDDALRDRSGSPR